MKCWGWNVHGELGNGNYPGGSNTAVSATGVSGATSLTAGWGHTCVINGGGGVECWGDSQGNYPGSYTAVPIEGVTGATALAAGSGFTCVIIAEGAMQCWGNNAGGQLGNGSNGGGGIESVIGVLGARRPVSGQESRLCHHRWRGNDVLGRQ